MKCIYCGGAIVPDFDEHGEPIGFKCHACGRIAKKQSSTDVPSVKEKEGDDMERKTCSKCGNDYSVENFSKNASTKDGLERWCKDCKKKAQKDLRDKKAAAGKDPKPAKCRYRRKVKGEQSVKDIDPLSKFPTATHVGALLTKLRSELYRIQTAIEVIERLA